MMNKPMRELIRAARGAGVTVKRIELGKHARLFVDTPRGERFCVVSSTPSDYRARRNAVADLRRLVAG